VHTEDIKITFLAQMAELIV